MKQAAEMYWDEFWKSLGQKQPKSVSSWQFGANPDYLAQVGHR